MYIKKSPKRVTLKGYKQNDCTVNALGNALGLSYDLSRKILQTTRFYADGEMRFLKKNPRTKAQFTQRAHVKNIVKGLSESYQEFVPDIDILEHYKKRNPVGTSLREFAKVNTKGVYILLVKRHLVTVIDGKIIDTWDSGNLIVEVAFKMDVNKAQSRISHIAKFYKMDSEEHIIKNHTKNLPGKQAA